MRLFTYTCIHTICRFDFVTISSCTDVTCDSKTLLATLAGEHQDLIMRVYWNVCVFVLCCV